MSKNRTSRFMPVIVAVSIVTGILIGTFYANHFSGNKLGIINTSSNKLNALLRIIDDQYVDTVNMGELVEDGIRRKITMMDEETGYIILDVRTAQEYSEKHIPGAINIANESIGTEDISELPDKDQLILVYCRSGNRSKQASEKLVKLGYTNIVEIGGINSWPGETVNGDK